MNKKVPVTLYVPGVRLVEMDQMGVESKCRKAEEQCFARYHTMAKFSIRGGLESCQLRIFLQTEEHKDERIDVVGMRTFYILGICPKGLDVMVQLFASLFTHEDQIPGFND